MNQPSKVRKLTCQPFKVSK
ncbi:unnamed protein product [Acanthoscelides obtectus]|uniref:Uncharacterized protein n=1 Tax=Acanthoscelides obtectus TaxID=200917 RepID=A0A9P0K1Z1_ACAOB|nr:unnamed protein product [Acanthoscelides obtectus]CAK1629669.1 hypothetical protein AOBTE_LOCUS5882 [Acanthoscelides obtectus]